eukprot:2091934-Rhodomonas_salina.4
MNISCGKTNCQNPRIRTEKSELHPGQPAQAIQELARIEVIRTHLVACGVGINDQVELPPRHEVSPKIQTARPPTRTCFDLAAQTTQLDASTPRHQQERQIETKNIRAPPFPYALKLRACETFVESL